MPDFYLLLDFFPENVQTIAAKYNLDQLTFRDCSNMEAELRKIGFTMDYSLDGVPYNLQMTEE